MYELTVEREFCAAHAIVIHGEREPFHGHTWRVRVVVGGSELDGEGLLCDFHELEEAVDHVIPPLHNADLNSVPAFNQVNPTAEHVARYIADAVSKRVPAAVRVLSVSVTEAPGCTATYRPG